MGWNKQRALELIERAEREGLVMTEDEVIDELANEEAYWADLEMERRQNLEFFGKS